MEGEEVSGRPGGNKCGIIQRWFNTDFSTNAKTILFIDNLYFFDDLVCFSFTKRPNSNVKQPYLKNKRLNLDLKL